MRFKEFMRLSEEDNGMLGFGQTRTELRKPSSGQPFKKFLSPVAGGDARGPSAGGGEGGPTPGGGAMFMKKKMKKS